MFVIFATSYFSLPLFKFWNIVVPVRVNFWSFWVKNGNLDCEAIMSKMDTDMITISRFITEKQRESGGSGEFTQLTNGLVSAVKEKGQIIQSFWLWSNTVICGIWYALITKVENNDYGG